MVPFLKLSRIVLTLLVLGILTSAAFAGDPGLPYPPDSEVSDQKAGSILVYNLYTSNPSVDGEDSRLAITNTSSTSGAFVHLFFIHGNTCSVIDRYTCLTANQTLAFLASQMDPGVTGFVVAVAVDGVQGCPINFNFLVGDVFVRFASGLQGNLGAEAIAAVAAVPAKCNPEQTTTDLLFDGTRYNRVPRVLAVSNFPAVDDGYTSRIWINRIGGDLFRTNASIGTLFGLTFNDAENAQSWTSLGGCQLSLEISRNSIRAVPPIDVWVGANHSGWMKFWSVSDFGILGCIITGPTPRKGSSGKHLLLFTGGRNLHKLSLTVDTYSMRVSPPIC